MSNLRFDDSARLWAMKSPLKAAMAFFEDTDALIVDLCFVGGGKPKAVAHALGYVVDPRTHIDHFFDRRAVAVWTRRVLEEVDAGLVYVLVGPQTASTAEEFADDPQALRRGTIVGAKPRVARITATTFV